MTKVYILCNKCRGSKKILGMGMLRKDCDKCDGIGYIEKEEVFHVDSINEEEKPKRGRPRKYEENS